MPVEKALFRFLSVCRLLAICGGLVMTGVAAPAVWANEAETAAYRVPVDLFASDPRGPHSVGTFEELWVNDRIDDPSTSKAGDARKLMVQVWYPSATSQNPRKAPYAISPQLYADDHWVQKLAHVRTQSVMGAPLATGTNRWPVLIYNHGGTHTHFSATFQTEFLASHGYVVVSIGHSGANEIRRFPDGSTYLNDGKQWRGQAPEGVKLSRRQQLESMLATSDVSLYVQDISFVLDRLSQMDVDPGNRLRGRLDLSRVGSLGWSLGGFTSLQATRDEPHIKAAANLDGWPHGLLGPKGVVTLGSEKPVLLMFGGEGPVPQARGKNMEADASRIEMSSAAALHFWTMLDRSSSDWFHITIDRTDHGSFADTSLFKPHDPRMLHPRAAHAMINAYVLAFFDKYVKGSIGDSPLLSGSVSYPEAAVLRRLQRK